MQNKRKPTAREVGDMTLREFAEAFVFDLTEQTAQTIQCRGHNLSQWERLTGNPLLKDIDDDTADEFRRSGIAEELAAKTINKTWLICLGMLRRAAPRIQGNPRGMGLLFHDGLPWMRPVKGPLKKLPYRIPLDDLSAVYRFGAQHADSPGLHIPYSATDWWRALLVLAYFTGLRRGDLMELRWDQISFQGAMLNLSASKTQKQTGLPLHEAVISHLQRIGQNVSPLVFCGAYRSNTGRLSQMWRSLAADAGVKKSFTLQNIRQTAASEAERIRPGGGALLLQHSQSNVTARHYLVQTEELREIINEMRVPPAFVNDAS